MTLVSLIDVGGCPPRRRHNFLTMKTFCAALCVASAAAFAPATKPSFG